MNTALSLPADRSVIVFDRLPVGTYASEGKPYRVDVRGAGRKAYVTLTCIRTGSGTFDRGWAYARAAFRTVEG